MLDELGWHLEGEVCAGRPEGEGRPVQRLGAELKRAGAVGALVGVGPSADAAAYLVEGRSDHGVHEDRPRDLGDSGPYEGGGVVGWQVSGSEARPDRSRSGQPS